MANDIVGLFNCKGAFHRRHCWRTCAAFWGALIGIAVYLASSYYNYPLPQTFLYGFLGVIAGALFGMFYYLARRSMK